MTVEKSLLVPSFINRKIRREILLFGEADGKLTASGLNVKRCGDILIPAEGAQDLGALPEGAEEIFSSDGHKKSVFAYGNGTLFCLETDESFEMEKPVSVLSFLDHESGEVQYFALTPSALYLLNTDGAEQVENHAGGDCGAVYYERLFTAKGVRVFYSKPLSPADWTEGLQTAGHLDLPSAGGEILALVPYKEKLAVFRRQGITLLRAVADTLNFKATEIPFSCGSVVEGSVQNIGERILFFTENGLYAFNGATCVRLEGSGQSLMTKREKISACAYGGKYYCTACALGEDCLFSADFSAKSGYYLREEATSVASADKLYFVRDGRLYALSEREESQTESVLFTELSLLGLSNTKKWLDAVCVEGEGRFFVQACADGQVRTAEGKAGERLRFPTPLKGSAFSFCIKTFGRTKLKAISLALREEKYGNRYY